MNQLSSKRWVKHDKKVKTSSKREINWKFGLTLVESWLERLITWSRASCSSRLRRRTSLACLCSSVVEPYIDDPPDINEIWLPWTIRRVSEHQETSINSSHTFIILLRVSQPMTWIMSWWKQTSEASRRWCWACWLTPRNSASRTHWEAVIRFGFNIRTTTQHWRVHLLRLCWSTMEKEK